MNTPNPSTSPPAPVIERVRKLLAKAERTEHPHEAEAFAAKAAELIAAHRITPAALAAARTSGRLQVRQISLSKGAYVRARLRLLSEIASTHDADVVFQSGTTGMVAHVVGFDEDLDTVAMLFDSLHRQASAQMAGGGGRTAAATQRWRRAFLFGYGERVGELMRSARRDAEAAGAVQYSGGAAGMALELRERRERVHDFTAESFPRVAPASRPAPASARGWTSGRSAADRADLGRSRLRERGQLGR